jgi:hypothetical protein
MGTQLRHQGMWRGEPGPGDGVVEKEQRAHVTKEARRKYLPSNYAFNQKYITLNRSPPMTMSL